MTSIIKVDNLQNQCGANIISESANVITIGASGDTVTLAAGASQSGFGRSGSVNWDTTAKTTGFTAVSGNGYFVNTTAGAITVTLPATPTAGDIVAIADYANTSATNNITVGRNGSLIDGESSNALIFVNGQVYTLVYVDATEGWKTVSQTFNQIPNPSFVAATGGTITTCGNYKIHTFTGPGTFTVSNAGNSAGSNVVDYLVVAGGGGGGGGNGPNGYGRGGGGAGGFRESKATGAPWTASPLASSTSLPVSVTAYPITVGSGGAGVPAPASSSSGGSGNNSIFSTITSAGGGGGGQLTGVNGGSGGGAGDSNNTDEIGGTGNTPPVSPSQGFPGGLNFPCRAGGGGGGATVAGSAPTAPHGGGPGGNGATTSISGTPTAYAGGGGGGGNTPFGPTRGFGGTGGGGNGGGYQIPAGQLATVGTINTGGGGGGGGYGCCANSNSTGAAGGSGIVVIRYKFQ
jgi:hypothetical protein